MTETRSFESLLSFIERELEFESAFYNDAYLDRRITARMRRTDNDGYREYKRLLTESDEEKERLLDSLSINVTGFFRNPDAWEKLATVVAELTSSTGRVRIWSAPCADGREPYSLAMLALDDDRIDEHRIEILGTDINADVLATARAGEYKSSQTTDIAGELGLLVDHEPYLERDGDHYRVRERVRRLVSFEQHDLIRGEPKRGFDLVLCRNLLIYIDSSYKTPVFETIWESLREGGHLMIGMTETLPSSCREQFEPVYKRERIYRRR